MTSVEKGVRPRPRRLVSPLAGWRAVRPYMGASRTELAALVFQSGFAGFAEAGVLLLVVQCALAVTGGESTVDLDAGPLSADAVGVAPLLGIAAVLLAVVFIVRIRSAYLIASISGRALDRSRRAIFRAFTSASWDVQSRERAGLLQDVMTTNMDRVAAASLNIATGLAAAFQFGALLVSGLAVQPAVAVLILVSVVALFFAFRPISRLSRRAARGLVRAKRAYVSGIAESVSMAQEIRTFDVGDQVVADLDADSEVLMDLYRRSRFFGRMLPSLYQNSVLAVILLGVVVIHVLSIDDVAALGAVVLMLVRALTYSQTIQTTHQSMADLMPYLHSMADDLARYEAAEVPRHGEALDRIDGIRLSDVTFTYTGSTRPALADVDLDIDPGEAIGIVGPSGSGKTTFMQVLLRLRQPQSGALLVNGRPAEELAVDDWFRKVALVPQEARLYSASVRDNVRFHRPHLTDDDLQRAVEQAHVADDIAGFEDGWDTHVGERGGGAVSGGQRQRICIARALAGRPDVLVLDEPTSALDMRSESLIRETLEELKGSVTLVIIAHRMSTLSVCDRLVVFEGGRIAASGPAEEMLRTNRFLAEASDLSRG